MSNQEYLDCELDLNEREARLTVEGRQYTGSPVVDGTLHNRLLSSSLDPQRYGIILFETLFPVGSELGVGYQESLTIARMRKQRLRLRLRFSPSTAAAFQNLDWELLYDPRRSVALGRSRDVAFSRFLSVPLAPETERVAKPRLLVVVAEPDDLAEYGLTPLGDEVVGKLDKALRPLRQRMTYELLTGPDTVARLRDRLVAQSFHILHLLAHGKRGDSSTAHLVLEDVDGRATFVGPSLLSDIFEGEHNLRLVTLMACHGTSRSGGDPFSGLGPALVRRGIPAVIAMRRAIRIETAANFTEHLYRNLARSGHIDAAANEARQQLHLTAPRRTEWSTPALYMRLADGRVWEPAQTEESQAPKTRGGAYTTEVVGYTDSGYTDSTYAENAYTETAYTQQKTASGQIRGEAEKTEKRAGLEPKLTGSRFFIAGRHDNSQHRALSQFLAEGLRHEGHQVFSDENIRPGADWTRKIDQRIRQCDVFVVLVSEDSLHNETAHVEIRQAHHYRQRQKKPRIVPIRLNYDGPLDYLLSVCLRRSHAIRWYEISDSPRVLQRLLELAEESDESGIQTPRPVQPDELTQTDIRRPLPEVDPRVSPPGGALRADDPFYVERDADAVIEQRAHLLGETLVIKAPRQMGKSSLLLHYLNHCRGLGKRTVLFDFSTFEEVKLDYPTLLTEVAAFVHRSLSLEGASPRIETQRELTNWFEDDVLTAVQRPLVLAFDEVDRVLSKSFRGDFFTMLRMWHNKRAEIDAPWEKVDIALVISTEPFLLVDSVDRSPFNVTPPVVLSGFDHEQCEELNRRYDAPLGSDELARLSELVGGHPYLMRLALYRLVSAERLNVDQLIEGAVEEDGPFGDHLRALLLKLCRRAELVVGLRQVLADGGMPEPDIYYRLRAAGLVRREKDRTSFTNHLYQRFFAEVIG